MASLHALRAGRKLVGKNTKSKIHIVYQGKRQIHTGKWMVMMMMKGREYIVKKKSFSSDLNSYIPLMVITKKNFHASSKPRWVAPEDLTTSELRTECERRQLTTNGGRTALIERLNNHLVSKGGHENGLTIDRSLVNEKRAMETELNRIPDKHFATLHLYVDERYQKKIAARFEDSRIHFHDENQSHVRFEGRYAEICHLRSQVSQAVADIASNETIYSLPHRIMLRLKRSAMAELRREHDVNFNIIRHKYNGDEMLLLGVEGKPANRLRACEALEEILTKIKNHSVEITGLDSFASASKKIVKPEDFALQTAQSRDTVADYYSVFNGVVLYMDPRIKEMMHDYQSRLDSIATETNTNIFLGNRDLFWLNDFQLAIEGSTKDVSKARQEVDQLLSQLKALTMTVILPPSINQDMVKESKQLSQAIQKQFGVDAVVIQHGKHIYMHLIGTNTQVTSAACVIDSRTHRLNKLYGGESERLNRRDRIRNLNFLEFGVGGLDLTLRDMLRRTFESRLISNRLREELGLIHVRGVLLYGPPGTGKTLVARKISNILGCEKPKIVNGPEVESKWVGEAEKNIRNLFEEAQQEFEEKGESSNLHVVIFDEIDAIAKRRGGAHAKSRDGALNQLLCCLDGINALNNVIVFGLTNRKDCLDPALLRPGRLEVQLEIGFPDLQGREDILRIHTQKMREYNRLDPNANLRVLAEYTEGFSGADLAGMVRSAVSYALDSIKDEDEVMITQEMLQRGLAEIRHAKERLPKNEDPEANYSGLLQA